MDPGYFCPKGELLRWLQSCTDIKLSSLDELSTGAVYCSIINQIHPNSIPPHKINFRARQEYEYLHNYKLLQQAFTKNAIQRAIPVERLIRGFDHIEMLQWIKMYFELAKPVFKENKPPRPRSIERSKESSALVLAQLRKENSLYVRKLSQIEIFVETYPENPVTESIKKLLQGE